MELPFAEIGRLPEEQALGDHQELSLGLLKFEISGKHTSGDVETAGYEFWVQGSACRFGESSVYEQ